MSQVRKGRPRYEEISEWLRGFVSQGAEGDVLPTELDLAAKFGVSRMTARQAVRVLEADGLVTRARGAGTFIAPPRLHRQRGPIESFHADISARGLRPTTVLLSAGFRRATEEEAKILNSKQVVSIRRLRSVNDVPIAIESAALIPELSPVLDHDLEGGSLYAAMRALGRSPTQARARITARLPTREEQVLLHLTAGAPVLVEDRVATADNVPVDATTAVYAAERYAIDADFVLGGQALPYPPSASRARFMEGDD